MENCNSEMLIRAMRNAGIRNGFDEIQAEFSAFRDFKLKWTRSYRWISFEVSDNLRNAPEHVMESLAETIFAKMRGEGKTEYSQEVCDYLNSDSFLKENQEIYLKRFRGISSSTRGENIDLMDSYRRLVESGLVEDDPRIVIRWNNSKDRNGRIGRTSVLMRAVIVNPVLDTEGISEDVLDYALYTLICRVNLGFGPSRDGDGERYGDMLSIHPERIQAETDLRRMGLSL
ncbi:hypothetical protein JS82_05655 [Methanomassiliicoccaceae archaeon DOK]|nr:hypothetical protein JS82_05655 [Methanomassiliicoccaceae archaeon DOK]